MSNIQSSKTWGDTNKHDATGQSKTKHIKQENTKLFKIKQEPWRDVDMTTQA